IKLGYAWCFWRHASEPAADKMYKDFAYALSQNRSLDLEAGYPRDMAEHDAPLGMAFPCTCPKS
ncbi:MAG: hypothetical protein ACKPKO_20740, partial [Candidatus Fonsibacter sp.]